MKVVYIAHPISGDVKGNLEKLKNICRDINLKHPDILPFVPYCMDLMCLDDAIQTERNRGIKNNTHHLESGYIDELWLYGDRISKGMYEEINTALIEGIEIMPMTEGTANHFIEL